jgi:hypothetical protein
MNRTSLISLTTVVMAMSAVVASSANAQEPASTPSKQYSIGPAIEFSGGGTSFGIKGKVGVGPSISVRPSVLFGYTPNVSGSDFSKAVENGAARSLSASLVALTPAQKRAIVRQQVGDNVSDAAADDTLAAAVAKPAATRTAAEKALVDGTQPVAQTPDQKRAVVRSQQPAGSNALTDAQADALITAAEATPAAGAPRTPAQQTLFDAIQPVPKTTAQKREVVRTQAANAVTDAQADKILADANNAPINRTATEQNLVTKTQPVPLTDAQKRVAIKALPGNAGLTDAQADAALVAAQAKPVASQTQADKDLIAATEPKPLTVAQKRGVVRTETNNNSLTDAEADKILADANKAPVTRTTAQQTLVNGTANLTTDAEKRVFVKSQPGNATLTNDQADALLADANKAPVERTPAQTALIAETKPAPLFTTLTPAEKRAQVRLFSEVTSDKQADEVATKTKAALAKPAADRTAEENLLVRRYGGTVGTTTFTALTAAEKRTAIKDASKLNDAQADVIVTDLEGALTKPVTAQSDAEKLALADSKLAVSFVARTDATGFTPGSGVAYGAAVTYDFATSDKKLTGYVGPRVMFASGTSKIGKFDTSTNETNFGLLLGADYEISPDFTAGLSGTYNFAKSGNLNVSAPGGFNGSSSVSGSSFDVGISLGYRF